jgi:16S rRNA (uracil1498-N3)-methyltransferase
VRATAHVYLDRLDDTAVVEGGDAHHLRRVRRVRAGEVLTAADGYGRWRTYDVVAATGERLDLVATTGLVHEPRLAPQLTVAFALTKGDRPEVVVQKLTELGVDRVLLVRAARSVVRWNDDRAAAALDRLRRIAREAGAQSRRARLPVVDGVIDVADLAGRAGLVLADPRGRPAAEVPWPPGGDWVVAVGPEGGFDDAELARLGAAPRLAVGPHVLRAETAAVAAAAALAGCRRPGAAGSAPERAEW